MPPLAPKRICRECGKDIGRKWKDGELCSSCTRSVMEEKEPKPMMSTDFPGQPFGRGDTITTITKDDIPY